ncbi:MAG: hydrogen peroxide-inducible genes activator [Bacteroidota bacterium]|nr:hydrogen peroxide-inducible genes activator [Bacteroidota bacterium]
MITLTQLEYIVAVDTFRHFGRAAENCFITQPTLSMQIKKLEEDLEVIIFDRSKQPLIPTDVGRRIIDQARIALQESQKINSIIKDHKNLISGELKIGIIPTLAPYLLPLFIGSYKRAFPKINIRVEELTTSHIIDRLNRDLLDVGILVTPLNEDRINEKPLFYEGMLLYVNDEHPLATKESIKLKDIATPDIWLLSDGHCFRDQVINLCSFKGAADSALPFHFESGSLETIMNIVDKEGGMTIIPELATIGMSESRFEHVRTFTDINPLREVSLVYSRHFAKYKLIELLWKEIVASMPEKLLQKNRGTIVEWR